LPLSVGDVGLAVVDCNLVGDQRVLGADAHEGRLYCNLIRSYVTFLMAEHDRMSRAQ
jgi:hypothetical protein